ncbi:MAG: enoyl-CoA hydratase [Nocardioides sp.]|jgi:acyl dehydratase|uniref:MaoC family dehydratase n=1 Tax=Nocardioides sp. TaxID=35761 RepID=UPI0026021649|nr:MaoC family dehydratase [Nocardioides sp.]MCW2835492.1 enoyl-CoA hydratase [Nocardioides sp.]
MRTFTTLDEVADSANTDLGTTDWLVVDQERINLFADATGDHQWIHVDEQRAQDGPFGTTIAHGFLTVSLLPWFNVQSFQLETPGARLNYGLNKVRFPHPVPVGSRLRSHVSFGDVTDLPAGKQLIIKHTLEIEGVDKPACVAELVVLLLP